jgi:hypothetical protein
MVSACSGTTFTPVFSCDFSIKYLMPQRLVGNLAEYTLAASHYTGMVGVFGL